MKTEKKWQILHDHRRMASRGLTDPIRCNSCGYEVLPIIDADLSPALRCMSCDTVIHLGLADFDAMEAKL